MSAFDTVVFPCPKCAHPVTFQSKGAAEPSMSVYLYPDVPHVVLMGIKHASECDECHSLSRAVLSRNGKRCALYADCFVFDQLLLASQDD